MKQGVRRKWLPLSSRTNKAAQSRRWKAKNGPVVVKREASK